MTPKIGTDFRKGSCTNSTFYSVLCASKRTRGAVTQNSAFSSVSETAATDFTLAPLSNDQVRLTAGREMDELSFVDMSGRVMSTRRLAGLSATVDLTGMATGVYVARVRFASGEYASRVFVRH